MVGLGGNVNSVTLQLYDPYNFPAVNLFEYDGCTGQSGAYGVRNFTVSGPSNAPIITEIPKSTYNLVYPALNANSILIPPYIEVESYNKGSFQQSYKTSNLTECIRFTDDYDEIKLSYWGQYSYSASEGNLMVSEYIGCMNTPGNSEQFCAAYDQCLETEENNYTYCNDHWGDFMNPNWVSGNCGTV